MTRWRPSRDEPAHALESTNTARPSRLVSYLSHATYKLPLRTRHTRAGRNDSSPAPFSRHWLRPRDGLGNEAVFERLPQAPSGASLRARPRGPDRCAASRASHSSGWWSDGDLCPAGDGDLGGRSGRGGQVGDGVGVALDEEVQGGFLAGAGGGRGRSAKRGGDAGAVRRRVGEQQPGDDTGLDLCRGQVRQRLNLSRARVSAARPAVSAAASSSAPASLAVSAALRQSSTASVAAFCTASFCRSSSALPRSCAAPASTIRAASSADLVVVQAALLLRGLEAFLNSPPASCY